MDNEMEKKSGVLNKIDGMSWKQLVTIKYVVEMGAQIAIAAVILFILAFVFIKAFSFDDSADKKTQQMRQAEIAKMDAESAKRDAEYEAMFQQHFKQALQGDQTQESSKQQALDSQAQQMAIQQEKDAKWASEQNTLVTQSASQNVQNKDGQTTEKEAS